MWGALALAFASGVTTFAGGRVTLLLVSRRHALAALSAGVLLALAAVELRDGAATAGRPAVTVLAVILVTYLVARLATDRRGPTTARPRLPTTARPRVSTTAVAAGFTAHSVLEGLSVGVGFAVDWRLGVLVGIAVVAHDLADGMTLVGFLLAAQRGERQVRGWLVANSLAPAVGAVIGSALSVSEDDVGIVLLGFAVVFVHAAATGLLDATHQLPRRRVAALAGGAAIAAALITHVAG